MPLSPQAVVNEDTTGNVMQLQAEIKKLKAALENVRGCEIDCVIRTSITIVILAGVSPEVLESPRLGNLYVCACVCCVRAC